MFYKGLGMTGIATGCESDSIQIVGGSMAGQNNSAHASQEVYVRWAPGHMTLDLQG